MTTPKAQPEIFTAASPLLGVVVGTIHGEIDLHNSPALRGKVMEALRKWQPKKLILNMRDVPYVDSSAVAVLVEALKELRRTGGRVVLAELQSRVKGLLEIARLDSIFGIAKDEAEAMEK
jgi:anti-sigma B factor antagonist